MKAMVLAAGKGARLKPLTEVMPKPIAPVAGKPIIEHIFGLLSESGFEEVHVNIHHLADVVLEMYGESTTIGGMPVHFSREEELLGTAGSVKRLASVARGFDDTFVVVMGDALTDLDLNDVVAFHKEKGALATMALMPVDDINQYGVVRLDGEGNIEGFQEKPRPEDAISTLANTGVYVLEPEVLDYIPDGTFYDFAHDVFPRLLRAGEKFVGYDEGNFYWSDIGTLEAYRQAQADVLSDRVRVNVPGERRREGRRGVWIDRGAWVHPEAGLRGPVVVGAGAVVAPGATLEGDVTVGRGCWVPGELPAAEALTRPTMTNPTWSFETNLGGDMLHEPLPAVAEYEKPWGRFEQYAHNVPCTVKVITVAPGGNLSLQYHHLRDELWVILDRGARVEIADEVLFPEPGERLFVPRGTVHRLSGVGEGPARILEVSFGFFDEEDIVRLEDVYGRVEGTAGA